MNSFPAFLGSLCRNPTRVGCIVPSSSTLARQIASLVDPASPTVLEIGAGTGAITKALLERGVRSRSLHAIELDARVAAYLRRQLPDIHVICGNALRLRALLPSDMFGSIRCIVSSLPLRNMEAGVRSAIMNTALEALEPGGQLIQFTYRLRCPLPQAVAGITSERVQLIWSNLPPAVVWRFRKAALATCPPWPSATSPIPPR